MSSFQDTMGYIVHDNDNIRWDYDNNSSEFSNCSKLCASSWYSNIHISTRIQRIIPTTHLSTSVLPGIRIVTQSQE